MAEDWLVDVRKYASDADEGVVAAIVRHCGIALSSRDSSLVAFSDRKETEQVREGFLKKKLALTHEDAALDAAIAEVGQRMKADRTKNRVTVYYLLAEHFGLLGLFGAAAGGAAGAVAGGAAAVAAGAGAVAAAATGAAAGAAPAVTLMNRPSAAAARVSAASSAAAGSVSANAGANDGIVGFGVLAFAAAIGSVMFAMVVAGQIVPHIPKAVPAPQVPAPMADPAPAPAPVAAAEPAPAPSGAGVVAGTRNGKPMLTTYFDSGKAVVAPDFQAQAAAVLAYLKDNPTATTSISGFNDPTGNAAANAELSKNRAKAVRAALVTAGVDEARTALVKPADTTTTALTPAEARRVEVTIAEQ